MAKIKKLKKYKAPDAKFLVVIDPWPARRTLHREFINNVAAWFQFMLRDDYPGETVRTIYTQGTHNNIIVELSESVDIQPYIGAHAHRRFLIHPCEDTEAVSYIYEYDYETQNDPTRRSWTARYPSGYDISILPFKENYPIPTPAPLPPIHIHYAKRPTVAAPPLVIAAPDDLKPPIDTKRSRTPSPLLRPREDEAKPVVKKRDPYEEDNDATRLLRTASLDLKPKQEQDLRSDSVNGLKETINHLGPALTHGHRSGPSNVVDDFLASIPVKKEEPVDNVPYQSVSIQEEGHANSAYRPSQELLAALADLPVELINPSRANVVHNSPAYTAVKKEEPLEHVLFPVPIKEEQNDSHDGEYSPSEELLAALADLPTEISNSFPATTSSVAIKVEGAGNPLRFHREVGENGYRSNPESTRAQIKLEPQDESLSLPLSERPRDPRRYQYRSMTLSSNEGDEGLATDVRIKAEPQDDHHISALPRTRDPRLIGRGIQGKPRVQEINHGRAQLPVSSAAGQVRDPRVGRDLRTTQAAHNVYVKQGPRDTESMPSPPIVRDPRLLRREQGHLKRVVDNGIDGIEGRLKRVKSED